MDALLAQILEAVERQLYYPALYCALAVPDICGVLSSKDGLSTPARYAKWFDDNVGPKYRAKVGPDLGAVPIPPEIADLLTDLVPEEVLRNSGKEHVFLSGEDCYRFRCSVLHQGRSEHPKSRFSRVMFVQAESMSPRHCSRVNDALLINVATFCQEVVGAARAWLGRKKGTQPFDDNFARMIQQHADGVSAISPPFPVFY